MAGKPVNPRRVRVTRHEQAFGPGDPSDSPLDRITVELQVSYPPGVINRASAELLLTAAYNDAVKAMGRHRS